MNFNVLAQFHEENKKLFETFENFYTKEYNSLCDMTNAIFLASIRINFIESKGIFSDFRFKDQFDKFMVEKKQLI